MTSNAIFLEALPDLVFPIFFPWEIIHVDKSFEVYTAYIFMVLFAFTDWVST